MRGNKNRFLYMILVGVAVSYLLDYLVTHDDNNHHKPYDILISVFITMVVWEGNLRIDHWINQHYSWLTKPAKRILIHLPISIFFSAVMIYFSLLGYKTWVCFDSHSNQLMLSSIVIGTLISVTILSIEISYQFFIQWKKSLLEIEKYKTENLQAQLQNLRNQINPHFLFNNLSVLSSLVYKDQDKAVDFINQLAKVYRYLLDNRNNELVTLETEFTFIRSYNYLLQIRFDKNLIFNINISHDKMHCLIPPMAIQMLIENAIKHNEISEEQPLTVTINTTNNKLEITNNLQPRLNQEHGSKTGLHNIKERYRHFTNEEVEIVQDKASFTVRIPLLSQYERRNH